MCQIFGINSSKPYSANELLRRFYANSTEHPDGWGLALFKNHGVSVEKEALQASKSKYLSQRLSRDITCENLLAHIRKASIGSIEYANCHPFVRDDSAGRTWTLVHNGTLFEPELITSFLSEQEGTTDSEAILLYLIDRIDQATEEKRQRAGKTESGSGLELDREERFAVIDKAVCDLSPENKLNLLIFDGEILYAHCNLKGTLYQYYEDGIRLIATAPLSFADWKPFPLNTLHAFQKGELLQTGTDHGNEFFADRHDMSMVYLSYASL